MVGVGTAPGSRDARRASGRRPRLGELSHDGLVEPFRPVKGQVRPVPLESAQIVDDFAARHHHTPLSPRGETAPRSR